MTWVKVCGLSTAEDVSTAVTAGADAVGFVIDPSSPRYVDVGAVARLARDVEATTVLVTVDMKPGALLAAASVSGVSGVQPHGEHKEAAAAAAHEEGLFVLLPHPMAGGAPVPGPTPGIMRLLDRHDPDRHGGTGERFDWTLLDDVGPPYVLAGGLDPDNVAEAVRSVRPWGVDASSGLEADRGVKDHSKVTAFVREAKQA